MMINEMKNSRSSDLLPMFYDCKYFSGKKKKNSEHTPSGMVKSSFHIRGVSH